MNLEGSYLVSKPKTDWVMRKSKITKKHPKSAIFFILGAAEKAGYRFWHVPNIFR